MKKITLFLLSLLLAAGSYAQSVAISDAASAPTPNASAVLDLQSATRGFLAPRMSSLPSPSGLPDGLIIYKDDGSESEIGYYYCKNNAWIKFGSASDATQWTTNGSDIYYNSGNVGFGTATPSALLTLKASSNTDALRIVQDNTEDYGFSLQDDSNNGYLKLNRWSGGANTGTLVTVATNGNVGIGTTIPVAKLHIAGSGNNWPATSGTTQSAGLIARLQSNSNAILDIGGNTNYGFWLQSTDQTNLSVSYPLILNPNGGNVGIGTTDPGSYKLYVNGSAGGTTAWTNTSDVRLKKDVVNINNGLDKVMQLRPVTFNWKQDAYPDINFDDRNHVGFIAQEVEEVVPQVVSTANDEMQTKSIAYSDLVPVLTKAIQEQQAEIEALKKELEEIKKVLQYKK